MEVGSFVLSKCGRDKDECFIVSKIDGEFAYLVDGRIRKLGKPKKKKLKHIKDTTFQHLVLGEKFNANKLVHDSEIFSAIRKFKEENINVER